MKTSSTPQQKLEILYSAAMLGTSYSNRGVTHYTGNTAFVMTGWVARSSQ